MVFYTVCLKLSFLRHTGRRNIRKIFKTLKIQNLTVMIEVHCMDRKEEKSEDNSSSRNIVKLPYYLVMACGLTFSTDGITISRPMVVYSVAIYILNLVLLFKNATCFDKEDDFETPNFSENVCTVIYQITLQILISFTLYGTVKKFPLFIKKLEKLELAIKDDSLQREIHSSMKRITIIGLVCSITFGIGLMVFQFLMNTLNTFENCPKHRWFFGTKSQYKHVTIFLTVGKIFPGFQCSAELTFYISLCFIVTMYFKYLRKQLAISVGYHANGELKENGLKEYGCSTDQILKMRFLFEHTCELTAKLDDGLYLITGTQLLFEIPLFCLYTYDAFVPEFRTDLLFYGLFEFLFCSVTLVATTYLNSEVQITASIH